MSEDPVTESDPVDASVDIPAGALSELNEPITITITEFDADDPALPPPPPNSLPTVFKFEPEGQTFALDVTITFFYLDADNDGFEDITGTDENDLQVNLLVAGVYVTVADCTGTEPATPDPCVSARDTTANTITVLTRQFSIYALSGPAATATPTPTPDVLAATATPTPAPAALAATATPTPAPAALPATGGDAAYQGIDLAPLLAGLAVALALIASGSSLAWAAARRARRGSRID